MIGRQNWQRRFLAAARLVRQLAEVMKESRRIAVAFVDLIPVRSHLAHFQVAGDERGFAGTGRASDPSDGVAVAPVEQLEQPRALERCVQARAGKFGQCGAFAGQVVFSAWWRSQLSSWKSAKLCKHAHLALFQPPGYGLTATACG